MGAFIDIIIDGSGSMGYMKGAGEEHENKYLIDETHTRTDLVKKIIKENLILKLDFSSHISINSFCNKKKLDASGKPVIKDKKYVEYPVFVPLYSGVFDEKQIINSINNVQNPQPGGTPLRWAILNKVNKATSENHHIIVFSDGDGHFDNYVDEDWHKIVSDRLKKLGKEVKIHIVGIAQNEKARTKSKNLCDRTNGVYVNMDAIDYDKNTLNSLLFGLKSNIASTTIQKKVKPIIREKPIKTQQSVDDKPNSIEFEDKLDIESQVEKNTEIISLISNQLDNILRLLESRGSLENESKVEVVENEAQNKRVGRLAEKFLYQELLKNNWEKVEWLNEEQEKYLPYDFKISDKGKTFYYECKGTSGDSNEFQLTKDEWEYYLKNKESYRVCFVSNVDSQPAFIRFIDLLEDMNAGKISPFSKENRKIKGGRIIFTLKE